MVKVKEIREAELAGDQEWIDGTLADLQALMVQGEGPELVSSGLRVEILGMVMDRYSSRSSRLVDELWKAKFQKRVFAGLSLVLLIVVAVGWYRFLYVEKVAQARAWRILNERQHLATKMSVLAAKAAFSWTMDRLAAVDNDMEATPEEKVLWKANLNIFAERAKAHYELVSEAERKFANYTAPEEISKFTYVKDPLSGATMPFNATADGSLDPMALREYLNSDGFYKNLLTAAVAYSRKGATPVPAFAFDPPAKETK